MPGAVTPWVPTTHPIVNGEEVAAPVANRPIDEALQRTQHLKDRLDNLVAGSGLTASDVTMRSDVFVGCPVYWNPATAQYEPALAALTSDLVTGGLVLADSAFVHGICIAKGTAVSGTVLFEGMVTGLDWTVAAGVNNQSALQAGAYYLSSATPGKLVRQKPRVSLFVVFLNGNDTALVRPVPRELLEDHIHYKFDLFAVPAGVISCSGPGLPYAFLLTDPAAPGWLPAGDAVFGGKAPVGAVFGYNLALHPDLQSIWPPVPVDGIYLEQDGIKVPNGRWSADANGLWWYANCYSMGPWSTIPEGCAGSSEPGPGCPVLSDLEYQGYVRNDPDDKAMTLWFVKMVVKTDDAVVTSIEVKNRPGQPLVITCKKDCATPAKTGALCLDINFAPLVQASPDTYYRALKEVSGAVFKDGPIITGIQAGLNVTVVPVAGKGTTDGDGTVRGLAVISALISDSEKREGVPDLTDLGGGEQDDIDGVFFLAFREGLDTAMRMRIGVAHTGLPPTPVLELEVWLLARAAATPLPDLEVAYRLVPYSATACANQTLPSSDTDIAPIVSSGCGNLNDGQYVIRTSAAIPVAVGDMVFIQLRRRGDTDGYPADVGLLRQTWRIRSGP